MSKYLVTAPLAFSQPTGEPSPRRDRASERVVHCEPGEVIELDDSVAWMLGRKVELYVEPPKQQKPSRRKVTRLSSDVVSYGGTAEASREPEQAPEPEQADAAGA